jgi:prophage tail gpP-like protein
VPNAWETAKISVGGSDLKTFETLQVSYDAANPPPTFLITMAGKAADSVKTGDEVTITLGGKKAFSGYVNTVQRSYDGTRHGVMIQGRSKTQDASDTSIDLKKDGNNGNFDGQTLQAIGSKVIQRYDFKFMVKGDDPPFPHVQIQPSESAMNLVERLSRMQKKWLIHDENGDLIASDKPLGSNTGTIQEGKNVLSMRCTVADLMLVKKVTGLAQKNGSDQEWAKKASQIKSESKENTDCKRPREITILGERPCTQSELDERVTFEAQHRAAQTIDCEATVIGWLTGGKSGDIWKPGFTAQVNSPMAQLSNKELWIQRVDFLQDNAGGTRTVLKLLNQPKNAATSLQPTGSDSSQTGDFPASSSSSMFA